MSEFPSLDDFLVTQYGSGGLVDSQEADVLQVAGKDHIEYCYENDVMLCSIDSNPENGMWRWMIIQRRPCLYMDDGNLGGTPDLLSAYEEAKDAYLSHRKKMEMLKRNLREKESDFGKLPTQEVLKDTHQIAADKAADEAEAIHLPPFRGNAYQSGDFEMPAWPSPEDTAGTHYATSVQQTYSWANSAIPPVASDASMPDALADDEDEFEDVLPEDVANYLLNRNAMSSTPGPNATATNGTRPSSSASNVSDDDLLDEFFLEDDSPAPSSGDANYPYVEFGFGTGDQLTSIDMDIDEFFESDPAETIAIAMDAHKGDRPAIRSANIGHTGMPSQNMGRNIRGDPK